MRNFQHSIVRTAVDIDRIANSGDEVCNRPYWDPLLQKSEMHHIDFQQVGSHSPKTT